MNMSFKEEAGTLDRVPSASWDVAEAHLTSVKASLIFETLTITKTLFIKWDIYRNLVLGTSLFHALLYQSCTRGLAKFTRLEPTKKQSTIDVL